MSLQKKLKVPGVQIRVGLAFLLMASLWKWFMTPDVLFSVDLTDGIMGLLYGVSIGLMLLGIWKNRRHYK